MLGNTHIVVGVASSLVLTQPKSITELVLAVGGGALGALISDIDVGTSKSHKEADKIITFAFAVVISILILDYFLHTEIIAKIASDSGNVRILFGIFSFIGICAFGKEQPHRSFMHSFLACVLLCISVAMIWNDLVPYFAAGFLSHLAIDSLNKRKLRLFYPHKKGFAFYLFPANGFANQLFFVLGNIIIVLELMLFVVRLFQ